MHPIDYNLLRRLVPFYHNRGRNDFRTRQDNNLFMLAIYLDPTLTRWGMNTFLRKAHFLGQTSIESWDFCDVVEEDGGVPASGRAYEGRKSLGNTLPEMAGDTSAAA